MRATIASELCNNHEDWVPLNPDWVHFTAGFKWFYQRVRRTSSFLKNMQWEGILIERQSDGFSILVKRQRHERRCCSVDAASTSTHCIDLIVKPKITMNDLNHRCCHTHAINPIPPRLFSNLFSLGGGGHVSHPVELHAKRFLQQNFILIGLRVSIQIQNSLDLW